MENNGFCIENFHLIGHSLGGHLVGFIGRSVFKNSDEALKISRITSLDPAGPLFYGIGAQFTPKLSRDDGSRKQYEN